MENIHILTFTFSTWATVKCQLEKTLQYTTSSKQTPDTSLFIFAFSICSKVENWSASEPRQGLGRLKINTKQWQLHDLHGPLPVQGHEHRQTRSRSGAFSPSVPHQKVRKGLGYLTLTITLLKSDMGPVGRQSKEGNLFCFWLRTALGLSLWKNWR